MSTEEDDIEFFKWLMLIAITTTTACMSPIYDTARTKPGITVGGGIAYQQFESDGFLYSDYHGPRGDLALKYAPVNWFSLLTRAGLGVNFDYTELLPMAAIGIKFSTPWKKLNMALGIEAEYPRICVLTPMIGISSKNREYLTAGIQTCLYVPMGAFVIVHPFRNWDIFAGMGPFFEFPNMCVGLGYTYTFPKKEKEEHE